MITSRVAVAGAAAAALCLAGPRFPPPVAAKTAAPGGLAVLEPAPRINFPSDTDSNSPAFWQLARGVLQLTVINSAPTPVLSMGKDLRRLEVAAGVVFSNQVDGGRWIEAAVADESGRLYGYYHHEPHGACVDTQKAMPRIGAARSVDGGRSWLDLGIVLGAARTEPDCETPNRYFAGGVGDFSVILDRNQIDLYFLFSSYGGARARQGVAIARMLWSRRDTPAGRVAIWSDGVWRYPKQTDVGWTYPAPTPIFAARVSWHSPRGSVDALWGPSVHWNTFLNQYVVLLNRAEDSEWNQEGIYLSATPTIEDPSSWSSPQKLLNRGRWYPQVIGLEPGIGTDKLAGERARFFMGGISRHEIRFLRPEGGA